MDKQFDFMATEIDEDLDGNGNSFDTVETNFAQKEHWALSQFMAATPYGVSDDERV